VTPPTIGVPAPDFTSRNQHGELLRLADLRGEATLLVFYPWAFSGICTRELAQLQDQLDRFAAGRARVLAISCDPMYALRVFAESLGLQFDLLTDHWPHGQIARRFGVFDEGLGVATRGSFLIDADGLLRWSVTNGIADGRDIAEHLAALHLAPMDGPR
jgi:peroxiredoxin